jgi:hypothetical protein
MREIVAHDYYRGRWPEEPVPDGEPTWLFYEVDKLADAVLRTVDVFADGRVARNSVTLEQRYGDKCPSLIDCSLEDLFASGKLEETSREQFEEWWTKGMDTPFWFVR